MLNPIHTFLSIPIGLLGSRGDEELKIEVIAAVAKVLERKFSGHQPQLRVWICLLFGDRESVVEGHFLC